MINDDHDGDDKWMITIINVLDYLVLQMLISVYHKLASHCHSILPPLALFLILIWKILNTLQ